MIVLASSPSVAGEGQLDHENPWPGLASYDETSRRFFSGRASEANEALRRIVDEPVTVLFGKSGLGKTSLLNAGVFPRLRERDFMPVLVRLHVRDVSEPLIEQVRRRLLEELQQHGIEHAQTTDGETLWEYLHCAGQEFWTPQNRLVRPVFVFDQFEELFTLGRAVPAQVEAFREDLADLAENRIPAAAARCHDDAPGSEQALNTRTMPYKIVLALREDFLPDLEGWRPMMPSLRRNRMRLLPMRRDQALEAVCNEGTAHLVSEPLGRKIVAFLSSCGSPTVCDEEAASGAAVEPALLSLFCHGINEQRKRAGKTSFDSELVEGAKGTIVRDFYVHCLADQPARVRRFVEDELVSESGYRNSYSVKDAVLKGAITESELGTLINRHLLRHEHHLGTDRIELTHDLLTRAVLEARDLRVRADRANRDWWQRLKFRSVAAAAGVLAVVFAGLWASASRARGEADRALEQARIAWKKTDDASKQLTMNYDRLGRAIEEARSLKANADLARKSADEERERSRSREFAAHAEAAMNKDPELAIALGLKGMALADTTEARSALIEVARYAWPYADLHQADLGGDPRALAISPGGGRLVVLAGNSAISVWDVTLRKPLPLWTAKADAVSVAFAPDEKAIAIGRRKGVDLVEAESGRVMTTLLQSSEDVDKRVIGFSPDGQWLASTGTDARTLLLANLSAPHAEPEKIRARHRIVGFAVLAGGNAVITVGGSPLTADKLARPDGWTGTALDLTSCLARQSVSPGAVYVSATWNTSACILRAEGGGAPIARTMGDGATKDIVWSTGGAAFVELVAGQPRVLDLVVGRRAGSRELKSRIKGAHPMGDENDKTQLVAISEMGARVALIDDDDHKLVRIYSVAGYKPFLSMIEGAFAVAPDGSWIAIARPAMGGSEQGAIVNVIPLEHAFAPNRLTHVRARITLDRAPKGLYASSSSLVVVHDDPEQTTSVFDANTGVQVEPSPSSAGGGGRRSTIGSESAPRTSPRGGFEIRRDGDICRIISRHDRALVATARNNRFRFSADDRWLAVWEDQVLTVYDLSEGEPIFRFREAVDEVSFVGQGIMHVRFAGNTASMLIPLQWQVMERLLKWLTSRELTPAEECVYGLRGPQCWNELPVQQVKAAH